MSNAELVGSVRNRKTNFIEIRSKEVTTLDSRESQFVLVVSCLNLRRVASLRANVVSDR